MKKSYRVPAAALSFTMSVMLQAAPLAKPIVGTSTKATPKTPAPKTKISRPPPAKSSPAKAAPSTSVQGTVAPGVEAWGILIQVMDAIRDAVTTKELGAVHNEDMRLSSAVTVLHQQDTVVPVAQREEYKDKILELSRLVGQLHRAADAGDQAATEARLQVVLDAFKTVKGYPEGNMLTTAQKRANRYTCPMHPDVTGHKDALCPICGMLLDQRVRLSVFAINATAVAPRTIQATVRTSEPLVVGVPVQAILSLQHLSDNKPVLLVS